MPPTTSDLPDPFNLRKKTVRFPDPERFVGKDPVLFELAHAQAESTQDRNQLLAAMEWNNRITWERLEAGDKLLSEIKIIRGVAIWALGGIISILLLAAGNLIATGAGHYMHWSP